MPWPSVGLSILAIFSLDYRAYFLASLHIQNFLFKFIYHNLRIIVLQYSDGTRTSLQVTEDQDSRTWNKSHGWLKRARSAKEEEKNFHWCM